FATGTDEGTRLRRAGEIGMIERVLAAVVATEVAFATEATGGARATVQARRGVAEGFAGGLAFVRERDGQRRRLPGKPAAFGRGTIRAGLRRQLDEMRRVGVDADDLFDVRVVRIEVRAGDRPMLESTTLEILGHEPTLVFADEHIGINDRSAPERTRHQRIDAAEAPDIVHPMQTSA